MLPKPRDEEYGKLRWLLQRYQEAEDYCRPYFDRAKRHYRLYRFGSAVDEAKWPYINRVYTRDIFAFVEDTVANMIQNLLGQFPWYSVLPRMMPTDSTLYQVMSQSGLDTVTIAEQMEKCLNYQAAHEDTEFLEEMVDFLKEGAIFGTSYEAVFPKFVNGQYMRPMLKNIGFWDCLPVPNAQRVSRTRGLFIREFMNIDEIVRLQKTEGVFQELDVQQLRGGYPSVDNWHQQLLQEVGLTGWVPNSDDIEVLHYFSGGHIMTLFNRAIIGRDSNLPSQITGKVEEPFPYALPIVQFKHIPVPKEFFGIGIPEILEVLQEDKNMVRSARRDNLDLTIHKILIARAGADINYDLIKYYGGAIWPVENMQDLAPFEQGDLHPSAYQEEEKIWFDMQNALSMFGYSRGMTPTHEERPTTVIKLQQAAMNRIDLAVKMTEFTVLQQIASRIILLTRRYMPQGTYEAIIGEPDAGFYKLPEEYIRNMFLIKPMGSSVTHIKELRQQQAQTMYQMLTNAIPLKGQGTQPFEIDFYEAIKTALDSLEVPNIGKILTKVDPRAMAMQQQQQMQQQMGIQQAMVNDERRFQIQMELIKQSGQQKLEQMRKVKYGTHA